MAMLRDEVDVLNFKLLEKQNEIKRLREKYEDFEKSGLQT